MTYPRFVDNTLDQEGDGVARFANSLHCLLMASISQVDPVHLVKDMRIQNV